MKAILFVMVVFGAVNSYAGADCPQAPKDKWLSEEQMKTKITEMGYKIKVFKVDGHCYEIYGWDKAGKKAEVYFNPVDGSIVKSVVK